MSMEPNTTTVLGVMAASSGAAAIVGTIGEVTTQILGVPLPVVLGAATGAFLARAYAPALDIGFFRALAVSVGWTIAGSVAAPFVGAMLLVIPGLGALKLPAGALAGIAGLVAAAPAWWPKVWPVIAARFGLGGGNAKP